MNNNCNNTSNDICGCLKNLFCGNSCIFIILIVVVLLCCCGKGNNTSNDNNCNVDLL